MAIKDYSTEPDMNTTISGINIAEGCAPSGINNAIRQLMADMKAESEATSAKDAEQDAAIAKKVSKVNDRDPDANGNVDVGGMPLGTAIPYTGKDVPAGTLRADGATYTNMQASFPEFYEWVVNSGLTVALGSYALVEGSCGHYGLDEATGTVRMPTLAAGVFGTVEAGKYGQAVQAGLPGITGKFDPAIIPSHASYCEGAFYGTSDRPNDGNHRIAEKQTTGGWGFGFDASRSSLIYGKSDTVTPSHVKYPWVIVVYNAAVSPSVAQAGEFVGLLSEKAGKDLENLSADGREVAAKASMPSGRSISLTVGADGAEYTAPCTGWFAVYATTTNIHGYVYIYNATCEISMGEQPEPANFVCRAYVPVTKGDSVRFDYGNVTIQRAVFVYAEGAE